MEIKKLFDETYSSNDGKQKSRNIWYGYFDISVDGEYGKVIRLDDHIMDTLCGIIKNDLLANNNTPDKTNWYFYGSVVTQDAIGENIRSSIMVRERNGEFVTNFNISDCDFALNIDAILSFKTKFEKRLTE